MEDPSWDLPPNENNAFEYFVLLWPATLCELVAVETYSGTYSRGCFTIVPDLNFCGEKIRGQSPAHEHTCVQTESESGGVCVCVCLTPGVASAAACKAT